MRRYLTWIQRATWRVLATLDAALNRLYGWRYNPFYQSGTLVVALFLVLFVTGTYLLFVYRVGAPYESIAGLRTQPWLGQWMRTLHRYASDAAVVAVLVHALRMFAQGRSWGPRTLAWLTGVILVGVTLVCGWTGFVMVWDVPAQVLAQEGARLLDVLPIFGEPIGRAFVGERPIPGAFFFLNLFAHIALPIGIGLLVWLHVSRVARPNLLPPRGLLWGTIALLLALSLLWPAPLGPAADLFRLPGPAPYDVFYMFWLPLSRALPAEIVWALGGLLLLGLLVVPRATRPAPNVAPPKSVVDQTICTGCEQCYIDCPYEAIEMTSRPERQGGDVSRSTLVAHVLSELCVSCGICAGSCAPMGVGPPGRTGRDQLSMIRAFLAGARLGPRDMVVIACDRSAGIAAAVTRRPGVHLRSINCAGNLHTSVVEFCIRSGAGGVLVLGCPPRDCWNREGPKWAEQRLYHDREAELQPRVDRRRVRFIHAAAAERGVAVQAIEDFRAEIDALAAAMGENDIDVERECAVEPVPPS
ncbi:MAG TPA: hydrogenase iron-sulfur subunit [Gemmatimonadales bacterium]|nr:hydrogenase iron-sulfur subunit [Gemmatimonadales bacterium]